MLGSRLLLGATSRSFAGFARKGTRKPPRVGTNRRMEPPPQPGATAAANALTSEPPPKRARADFAGANGDAHGGGRGPGRNQRGGEGASVTKTLDWGRHFMLLFLEELRVAA